jgi:hypothetical protein
VDNKLIRLSVDLDIRYSGDVNDDGELHGYGEYTVASKGKYEGDVFIGEFQHGLRHGHGSYTKKNGQSRTGAWLNSKINGVAKTCDANGDQYAGQMKESKKQGFGKQMLTSGEQYIGQFDDDRRHGTGLLVHPDGSEEAIEYQLGEIINRTKGLMSALQVAHD